MKKYLAIFGAVLLLAHTAIAQKEKTAKPTGNFSDSLTKIIIDFKYNYKRIQGAKLMSGGGVDRFKSKVLLPGAIENTIIKYHSNYDTTATWQGLMYDGDDYDEAVKVYKELYRKVRNHHMKWYDKSSVSFIGKMEAPNENLRFALTTLKTDLIDQDYKMFRAQIEMTSSYSGWEVHLNLQNVKDDMKGNMEEEGN